jgi:hypothetical protein
LKRESKLAVTLALTGVLACCYESALRLAPQGVGIVQRDGGQIAADASVFDGGRPDAGKNDGSVESDSGTTGDGGIQVAIGFVDIPGLTATEENTYTYSKSINDEGRIVGWAQQILPKPSIPLYAEQFEFLTDRNANIERKFVFSELVGIQRASATHLCGVKVYEQLIGTSVTLFDIDAGTQYPIFSAALDAGLLSRLPRSECRFINNKKTVAVEGLMTSTVIVMADGGFKPLLHPYPLMFGGQGVTAYGLSEDDEVVGAIPACAGLNGLPYQNPCAVYVKNNNFKVLDSNFEEASATDVNKFGEIVGGGRNTEGEYTVFYWPNANAKPQYLPFVNGYNFVLTEVFINDQHLVAARVGNLSSGQEGVILWYKSKTYSLDDLYQDPNCRVVQTHGLNNSNRMPVALDCWVPTADGGRERRFRAGWVDVKLPN